MNKTKKNKKEVAEDYCFICKDGGHLRACDDKNCLKAYHPQCVGKDPSFLETDERWTCAWHLCFICKKSSTFQCFCCPNSVCRSCIREAEFVRVKRRLKGFCYNCLKLAMLLEDSDGGKVDFKDSVTYEFLFKDYWEIVKDQEGLTLVDLNAANALLKQGENCKSGSDADRFPEKELISEYDGLEDDCDTRKSFLGDLKVKHGRMKTPIKRFRSKRRTYVGWGSEELIGFLTSIGKDAKEPLTQLDASEIVKDYVQANNLFHPAKKKKKVVACDEKLYSLFRKKNLKVHKIYSLLESHLAANVDMDDEFSLCSEDDDNSVIRGKQRRTNSDSKIHKSELNHCKRKVMELPKSCYASVVDKNIKSIYLRRSLIMNLLKNPENFENKVIGCFVRVKNDPKDFYHQPQNLYQLGQVTGIKKAPQAYKVGEMLTDTVLCVSNMCRDIQISLLSDDDFKEEECEVLQELVKKGLLKRPMVADLEKMIRNVHEDITNHWIDREIVKLQKLIDQANEKGWRRELFEYIERRELLCTPAERSRLLKDIPQVIADTEEIGATIDTLLNSHGENKGDMPRSPRFDGVQFQHSRTEADTFVSTQQAEAGPSAQQSTAGPSSSGQQDPTVGVADELHIQDGSRRVTRRRGPMLGPDVWQMCKGEKIVVECNQLGQPIKKGASLLSSFLGTVARKHRLCPLSYAKWNDMLPTYKVEILRVVQSKFVLPPSSHDFVLKSLNRKWKEYKAYLKMKHKLSGMTEEQVVGTCPPDVPPHQWMELVHYWFSERGQTYSDIGKAARAALSVPHTSGSKSYARVRQEFMDEHGREPGEVEFYRMTHIHHDGTFVRDESRDLYERATALIAERVDDSTASTQSSHIETEVFTELMGPERYGRVRGYGVGVTPTQLSAVSRYTRDAADGAQDARVCKLEQEIEEMRQSRVIDRAAMDSMREHIERLTSIVQMFVPRQAPGASDPRGQDDDLPPADH